MELKEALNKSKKVRRKHWNKEFYILERGDNKFKDCFRKIFNLKPSAIKADDWEVYEEQKENEKGIYCCVCKELICKYEMDFNACGGVNITFENSGGDVCLDCAKLIAEEVISRV